MNVFLVLSPLQLINAIEAKAYFSTENNMLFILRDSSLFYPISMYRELIDESEWDQITYFATYHPERIRKLNKFRWFYLRWQQRIKIDKLIKSIGKVEGLFIGRYREPITRHIANTVQYDNLYLLDDGTDTLIIGEQRRDLKSHLPISLLGKLSIFLLGISNQQAPKVTFFTTYSISVEPQDELVLHSFPHLRRLYADAEVHDEVWLLGQPLVIDGFMDEMAYLSYLRGILHHYQGQNFVYIPHPRERDADVKFMSELFGFTVRRLALLVEFALIQARPREVISFISSALPNCHALFGDILPLTSIYIRPEDFTNYKDFARSVYTYFREQSGNGFRVLEIEPIP